jgi:hypothetical protein
MASKYIVETEFLYGWRNVWTDEHGNSTVYNTRAEAEAALKDFIQETELDFEQGNLEEPYNIDDYRIVEFLQSTTPP